VYLVPAFVGLGAPHWDPDARAAILGLSRGSEIAHIARAALESVAYQTAELLEAMAADGAAPAEIRVDGGMARNDWFLQTLADFTGVAVRRPANTETTVLGAAILAAIGAGLAGTLDEAASLWRLDRAFEPSLTDERRLQHMRDWKGAVARVRSSRTG